MPTVFYVIFALLGIWAVGKVTGLWAFLHHRKLVYQHKHQNRKPEAIIRGKGEESFLIEPVPGKWRTWLLTETDEEVTSDRVVTISTGRVFSGCAF